MLPGLSLLTLFVAAVHVVDFYLDEKHSAQKAHIVQLVQHDDVSSVELVRGYVREAMSKNEYALLLAFFLIDGDDRAQSSIHWSLARRCGRCSNPSGSRTSSPECQEG